jgi:hypothetical protein
MIMKNIKSILFYFFALAVGVTFTACDDEEAGGQRTGAFFERTASSFAEGTGDAAHTITIQNFTGNADQIEFDFGGSATEGEDYTVTGFSNGVLTLNLIDDTDFEANETITVRIADAAGGVGRVPLHTVNISSNCEDLDGLGVDFFDGDWSATEFYCGLGVTTGSCDYGPYDVHLVQDEEDPTKFILDDFYDSGYEAYMVFDMENGTVSFPDQNAQGDGSNPQITASSGTYDIDLCAGTTTLTINLNYDGGDWIYYFEKH